MPATRNGLSRILAHLPTSSISQNATPRPRWRTEAPPQASTGGTSLFVVNGRRCERPPALTRSKWTRQIGAPGRSRSEARTRTAWCLAARPSSPASRQPNEFWPVFASGVREVVVSECGPMPRCSQSLTTPPRMRGRFGSRIPHLGRFPVEVGSHLPRQVWTNHEDR